MRAAGAHVVIADGWLVGFVGRNAGSVAVRLPEDEPLRSELARAAAGALRRWALAQALPAIGWSADADPPLSRGPLAPFLREAGFEPVGPGFRLRSLPPEAPGVERAT
jgi:ATP-dependent Lhr-like helicase